jgi:hypothetical protein
MHVVTADNSNLPAPQVAADLGSDTYMVDLAKATEDIPVQVRQYAQTQTNTDAHTHTHTHTIIIHT